MPKLTECLLDGRTISIDRALELKKDGLRGIRPFFECPECGHSVRPHASGGHAAAHFEHHERNPTCSKSDHLRD